MYKQNSFSTAYIDHGDGLRIPPGLCRTIFRTRAGLIRAYTSSFLTLTHQSGQIYFIRGKDPVFQSVIFD